VGDVQGCHDELQQLLELAGFDLTKDELWLTGDLVARGPLSLEVLRFVHQLGQRARTVLGNHDLHLLATAAGHVKPKKKDKLEALLAAPDRDELLHWLRQQPLLVEHESLPVMMCHAGLSPQWDLDTARACAREVEALLRGDQADWLLQHMYGDEPSRWDPRLVGLPRWRYIINSFTRLRFCHPDGRLEFHNKLAPQPGGHPDGLRPWFELRQPDAGEPFLVFGHWAALLGQCSGPQMRALDTGCVWGNQLSLWRWEDGALFALDCPVHAHGE